MKINPDIVRLQDIIKSIDEIGVFLERSSLDDRMTQMAVAYEIAIIGEACNKLSDAIKADYTDIPWSAIIGMRHRIIHDYGNVSIPRLKAVVSFHLPTFRQQIIDILGRITHV